MARRLTTINLQHQEIPGSTPGTFIFGYLFDIFSFEKNGCPFFASPLRCFAVLVVVGKSRENWAHGPAPQ
jgi:hypothetical protein